MGLITHVTDEVPAVVESLCAGILAGAPRAVAETKRLLQRVPTLERDVAYSGMRALSDELFASAGAHEGMTAFKEKRSPNW